MYFDIIMPLAFFGITLAPMFLNKKIENKLKGALEGKEFGARDAIFLVAAISVMVSIVVFIPQLAIMTIFLFSYSMLLFVFTYIFSDIQKSKAQLFSAMMGTVSLIAAIVSQIILTEGNMNLYGTIAFLILAIFAFATLLYDKSRTSVKERWYLAVLPPALFILMYAFFGRTPLWFPYLLDMYATIFAVLIILYLGSLFTWKTSLLFVGLLTVMDTILVLVTRSMVSAATHIQGLMLPVLIQLPTFPTTIITAQGELAYMGLGLGDFFFAGLLTTQTMKKFGKRAAILSLIGMSTSFFIFEVMMLNYNVVALPGTVMIICGWLPVMLWKNLKH